MVDCCGQFKVVFLDLVLLEGTFSVSLLLGKSLVLFLQGLELSVLAHGVLVLEHATHTGDGGCLFSVCCILIALRVLCFFVFVLLLVAPCLLLCCLVCYALSVEQILTFKLTA